MAFDEATMSAFEDAVAAMREGLGAETDNDDWEPSDRWRLRPIVIAEGNTLACVKNVETTFDEFSYKLKSARPGPKEGSYYTQGKVRGVRRGNEEMCTQSLAVLDVDAGQDPKEIIARAREYGLHVLIHSTHSSTPEHQKFRVVAPLDNDVPTDLQQWPRVIKALATLLGAAYDKACTDPGRLFYHPRHPADQKPWWLEAEGAPVRYADLLAYADWLAAQETQTRDEPHKRKGAKRPQLVTPNLFRFAVTCDAVFDIELFYKEHAPDDVRGAASGGGQHCRCPNEDGDVSGRPHTERGSHVKAFRVVNAWNNKVGQGWTAHCLTGGCTEHFGKDRLLFLDALCQQFGITDAIELLKWCSDPDEARKLYEAWDDFTRKNGSILRGDPNNIRKAITRLGVELRFDEFAERMLMKGLDGDDEIEAKDADVMKLRFRIYDTFGFLPTKDTFYDLVPDTARENTFHPVKDYLDVAQAGWDGIKRVDTFSVVYLGTEDTPFNRAAIKAWLIAAVRRIRAPGTKFDELPTFEGPQGTLKSTALKILAVRPEWFSDGIPLNADSKVVIERTKGIWIVEIAEMFGMKKDIDSIKAFLSRWKDQARGAYGRIAEVVYRQFICAGTTNSLKYLRDLTGNRRFWPIKIGTIDLAMLKRDLDQIWGEAAAMEAAGVSTTLDSSLWDVAAKIQDERRVENPYFDVLQPYFGEKEGRIRSTDVYKLLRIPVERQHQGVTDLVNDAMARLRWAKKPSLKLHGKTANGFMRHEKCADVWTVKFDTDGHVNLVLADDPEGLRGRANGGLGERA